MNPSGCWDHCPACYSRHIFWWFQWISWHLGWDFFCPSCGYCIPGKGRE